MNRRQFNQRILSLSGGLALFPSLQPRTRPSESLRVDSKRLNQRLRELATFGATPEGGCSRLAFSPEDLSARRFLAGLMRRAGLTVHVDEAGNLIGRSSGNDPQLAPLMLGSHIDTVPAGGRYDGTVGVMAAIEVAQTLHQGGHSRRHPLEVVVFANEEGGKTGSRLLIGEVMEMEFDLVTRSGKSIRDGIRFIGGAPDRLGEVRRQPGEIAAYLELHIEQGAVLDKAGIPIGVVQGIVGIKRWSVTVEGFANHAGTTPMDQRRDALVAAARFVDAADRVVRDTPGQQVGTMGRIEAFPGAPNVIPGRVQLSLELRDLSMEKIDSLFKRIEAKAQTIAGETGTRFRFEHFYTSRSALTDERLRKVIDQTARGLGLETLHLPSGAGHDAQSIARLAPIGMIFIPSREGISHSPREFSSPEHITHGADVLLQSTLSLDAALD